MKSKILPILVFLLLSTQAFSKIIGRLDHNKLKNRKDTHVFIVGYAGKLSTLFVESAISTMRRVKYLYPGDNILLIKAYDEKNDTDIINRYGINIIKSDNRDLTLDDVDRAISKYGKKVKSMHIFSHAAAWYGPGLQKGSRMSPSYSGVKNLRKYFVKDAYAGLYGCNTGFKVAPDLAKTWGIPVYGSLTSTDFQEYFSDGKWYHHNSTNQYPSNGSWAKVNSSTYNQPVNCWRDGGCVRMKPDNIPYTGTWGSYEGGLGFYKAFCPYSRTSECEKVMAKMVMTYPSTKFVPKKPTREQYREHVIDFLCPRYSRNNPYDWCRNELIKSEFSVGVLFSPFWGDSLECNLKGCDYEVSCQEYCIFKSKNGKNSSTMIKEFKHYMNGYNSL